MDSSLTTYTVPLYSNSIEGTMNIGRSILKLSSSNNLNSELQDKIIGKQKYRTNNLSLYAERLMCSHIYENLPNEHVLQQLIDGEITEEEIASAYSIDPRSAGRWFWAASNCGNRIDLLLYVNKEVAKSTNAFSDSLDDPVFRESLIRKVMNIPADVGYSDDKYKYQRLPLKEGDIIKFKHVMATTQIKAAVLAVLSLSTSLTKDILLAPLLNDGRWNPSIYTALKDVNHLNTPILIVDLKQSTETIYTLINHRATIDGSNNSLENQKSAQRITTYGALLAGVIVLVSGFLMFKQVTVMNNEMEGMNTHMSAMSSLMETMPTMEGHIAGMGSAINGMDKNVYNISNVMQNMDHNLYSLSGIAGSMDNQAREFSTPMRNFNNILNPFSW